MTTKSATKTPTKRGMSNTAEQDYLDTPETSSTVLEGVIPVTATPTAPKRARKTAPKTEVAPEVTETPVKTPVKRTPRTVKADASKTAEAQVEAVVTPKRTSRKAATPTLPDTLSDAGRAVFFAMVAGASGYATDITAAVEGLKLPNVKAALMSLVGFNLVEKRVETLNIGGRDRAVEAFYLVGKAPKETSRELDATTITRAAKAVAKTTAPTPRKRAEAAPVVVTKTDPKAKAEVKAARAAQTRPFVDGEIRTQRVNGEVRVIGTPLNPERCSPGELQALILAYLMERPGQTLSRSTIARGLKRWPAQTGRSAERLIELFEADALTSVIAEATGSLTRVTDSKISYRYDPKPQVKPRATRSRKA